MAWAALAVNPKPLPLCPWKKCFLKSLCHLLSKELGCPAGLCCILSAWAPCFPLPETCHGRSWVKKKKNSLRERACCQNLTLAARSQGCLVCQKSSCGRCSLKIAAGPGSGQSHRTGWFLWCPGHLQAKCPLTVKCEGEYVGIESGLQSGPVRLQCGKWHPGIWRP